MGILYITRHGETEYNRLKRFMGQKDIKLNKTGIKQAHKLGKKMKNIDIDFIITSPLKRAKQTAEIVSQYINKKIILDSRLKERRAGVYEGLIQKEVEEKFQKGYSKEIKKIYNEVPPGGESVGEVEKRVFEVLDELKKNYSDKKILVITHSFIARMINKRFNPSISEQEFFDFALDNTEIKKFIF